jgi:F-type H+-transporting ATPase subunit beta
MFVSEVFTGKEGRYVKIEDTLKGFAGIIAGAYDRLSENAFYMIGGIEEADSHA